MVDIKQAAGRKDAVIKLYKGTKNMRNARVAIYYRSKGLRPVDWYQISIGLPSSVPKRDDSAKEPILVPAFDNA
jgi:hypothetical protein